MIRQGNRWVDPAAQFADCATAFDGLRSGYDAARQTRYRSTQLDIPMAGANADWHYRTEASFLRVLEWARGFDRNHALIGQAINRLVGNVLMGGPTLAPDTGDKKMNGLLYDRVMAVANDADRFDARGEMTLHEMGWLILRSVCVDGEITALPLEDRRTQVLESHRLRSPTHTPQGNKITSIKNMIHGVEVDDFGRPNRYWFTKRDIGTQANVQTSDMQSFQAYADWNGQEFRNVWQVLYPKRVSQTRGISMLAPVFDYIGMYDDIQLAKLVQQQVASCFVFLRKKNASQSGLPGTPIEPGYTRTDTNNDGSSRLTNVVGPGSELIAGENEEITGWSPNIPGQGWLDQASMVLSIIAVNLDLPPMVFTLDPSSNFSGHRGAMEQARIGFRALQRMLIQKFYSRWYRQQVRHEIATDDRIARKYKSIGDQIFAHKWNPPAWPYFQPMEEAQARAYRRSQYLATPSEIAAEESRDFETVVDASIRDNVHMLTAAATEATKLQQQFPDQKFTWQQVLQPLPSGMTQNFVTPDPKQYEPQQPKPATDTSGADDQ